MFVTPRASAATAAATLIAILAVASPALGQERAFRSTPAAATVSASDDAGRLFEEGKLKDARAAYLRATNEARANQEYAKAAFAGLANVQFVLGDIKGAARAFDELGERAAAFGDPETEINALFNSAVLFAEAGDAKSAAARVPRLKTLLQSPVISENTRRLVAERIAK